MYWMDLKKGEPCDGLISAYRRADATSVVRESDALVRFSWHQGKEHSELWVDTEKGFSPQRLQVTGTKDDGSAGSPLFFSDVTWDKVDNVWVPTSFRIQEQHMATRVLSYELSIEWEKVNKEVDGKLFGARGMSLPTNTAVVDNRLTEPFVVDQIGMDANPVEYVPQLEETTTKYWLVIVNLAAVLIVTLIVIARRLRRNVSKTG
jgi:hypothetical protein